MKITFASYVAEYLGTFLFLLAILASGGNALMIGLALMVVIYLIGSLSGGHVNPAVTLMMFMKGGFRTEDMIAYIAAQVLGGMSALWAFRAVQ